MTTLQTSVSKTVLTTETFLSQNMLMKCQNKMSFV